MQSLFVFILGILRQRCVSEKTPSVYCCSQASSLGREADAGTNQQPWVGSRCRNFLIYSSRLTNEVQWEAPQKSEDRTEASTLPVCGSMACRAEVPTSVATVRKEKSGEDVQRCHKNQVPWTQDQKAILFMFKVWRTLVNNTIPQLRKMGSFKGWNLNPLPWCIWKWP